MKESVVIAIPVYNDFDALNTLIQNLETSLSAEPQGKYALLVINDGSIQDVFIKPSRLFNIRLIHLHRNMGHQKAIAIGLAFIHHNYNCDYVIVMDADGEDRPEDIIPLLQASAANADSIVFAHRKRRQEGAWFKVFYSLYKVLFYWLTGKRISFGNYMIIPKKKLDKLVYHNEIWSHLPAGIIKSGLQFTSIPADRGKRYAGSSKMNFTSLVLHGLGGIAVFLEQVASRLLIFSFVLIIFSLIVILTIIGIRTFTDLAIPGWASTILSSMLIVLLQGFLLSLFTIFLFLSSQSHRKFIPAHHFKDYTASDENISNE